MPSAHDLVLLGSENQNHMWNAPGGLPVAWCFVNRGTQGVCLNSELGVLSLDFSEPRYCADTIDMDWSLILGFVFQVGYNTRPVLSYIHAAWVPLYSTFSCFLFCVQKCLGIVILLKDTQGLLLNSACFLFSLMNGHRIVFYSQENPLNSSCQL